jgi:hypothetical protein
VSQFVSLLVLFVWAVRFFVGLVGCPVCNAARFLAVFVYKSGKPVQQVVAAGAMPPASTEDVPGKKQNLCLIIFGGHIHV